MSAVLRVFVGNIWKFFVFFGVGDLATVVEKTLIEALSRNDMFNYQYIVGHDTCTFSVVANSKSSCVLNQCNVN